VSLAECLMVLSSAVGAYIGNRVTTAAVRKVVREEMKPHVERVDELAEAVDELREAPCPVRPVAAHGG
jgi:hypothetical protein